MTASDPAAMRRQMIQAKAEGADAVECRLDFLDSPPDESQLRELLTDAPLPVIVTCRPVREGGHFEGEESARLEVLRQAASFSPAFVDMEIGTPREDWPGVPIILSHHDFEHLPGDMESILAEMERSDASTNKVAFLAAGPEDAFRAFDAIRGCTKPTLALAMGEGGVMSRILAGKFGAFGTFASVAKGAESAPGQPTIFELRGLYRWDAIGPQTAVCGVIGCPVGHSMSPAIHNAAFTATGADAVYVPLLIQPGSDDFTRFMDALLARPWIHWRGLSVTIPHKEHALAYVGPENCDELACKIGAVNTITLSPEGKLRGDNTDYAAAIDALCDTMGIAREGLAGRTVAVLGAGGAARAIVAALAHYRAQVTIYNRTVSRCEALAEEFSCEARGRDALDSLDARIVINCTSIGMHPKVDASPMESIPSSVEVVFDTVYNPIETLLLSRARDAGCLTVTGLDMFVNQAAAQFEIWTGQAAPRDVMRDVVVGKLAGG